MEREKKTMAELCRVSEAEYHQMEKRPISLLADNVRSMQNIGSMLRTCDAFRIREMIMCGISGTPPHREISKTALGAENSVSWRYAPDAYEEVRRLQRDERRLVCVLEQTHNSVPLQDFAPEPGKEYVIVVGHEVEGVDQRIVDAADIVLEIPQEGTKHSLNVAVSAGITLWQFVGKGGKS